MNIIGVAVRRRAAKNAEARPIVAEKTKARPKKAETRVVAPDQANVAMATSTASSSSASMMPQFDLSDDFHFKLRSAHSEG